MVQAAQANKTIPIIGTIPPSFRNNPCADDIIAEVNANIHSLAAASNVVVAEIFDGMNQRELFGISPDRDPHPPERAGLPGDGGHLVPGDAAGGRPAG